MNFFKKNLTVYLSSFKQSVFHKPIAMAMFVLMIIVATVACGFASRLMIIEAEQEIYADAVSIECNQDADYRAIGDYMRSIKEEYFDEHDKTGKIEARLLDVQVIFEDTDKLFDSVDIYFEVFDDKFSNESIEIGQRVMYVNNVFCDVLDCEYGDYITFAGTEFFIAGVENSSQYETNSIVTMPYTAELSDLQTSDDENNTKLLVNKLSFRGLKSNLSRDIYEGLNQIGVRKSKHYTNIALVQTVFILILFLVASSLSVISVTNYWQSVNARKYNIYKMVGGSPRMVAGVMLFETGVVATVAVGIGMILDYLISLFVDLGVGNRVLWLHYLILFISTLLAVMIMVTIKVIKQAKLLPKEQTVKSKKRGERHEKDKTIAV